MQRVVVLLLAGLALTQAQLCPGCKGIPDLDKVMSSLNISGTCQVYGTAYACTQACPTIQASLTAYVSDFCVAGGPTLNPCGSELSKCIADLQQANAAAASNNMKPLCVDVTNFFHCANDALTKCTSTNATKTITMLKSIVGGLDMEEGCDAQCALQVGQCETSFSSDLSPNGQIDPAKFQDMCRKLGSATSCINPLKKTVCANNTLGITVADKMLQQEVNKFSDLCDTSGNPTDCATGFVTCGNILKTITQANQCGVTSNFLTCVERLPCKYSVEDTIKQEIANITVSQKQTGCTVVGGCTDRYSRCSALAKTMLDKVNSGTSIDTFCNTDVKSIESCYITVRGDPTCKEEKLEVGEQETQFFDLFTHSCGNSSACSQSIVNCKADYAGITAKSKLPDKCFKIGKAVGCINEMFKSDICVRVGQKATSDDVTLQRLFASDCGNISACDTGIHACYSPLTSIINDPDSAAAKDCPVIQSAVNCIDASRTSPLCVEVKTQIQDGEKKIKTLEGQLCGGVSIQASVLLIAIALFASFWKQ